jgi:hypothetical protein
MSFLGLYRDPAVARVTLRCDWRTGDLVGGKRPVTLRLDRLRLRGASGAQDKFLRVRRNTPDPSPFLVTVIPGRIADANLGESRDSGFARFTRAPE